MVQINLLGVAKVFLQNFLLINCDNVAAMCMLLLSINDTLSKTMDIDMNSEFHSL